MSLVEAEDMLMKCAKDRGNAQRYALKDLGISWLNRRVSGKHTHKIGRRIYSVEGLVRIRYGHGLAHEPDPEDPLKVARHTNEVAEKDPLIATVPEAPLLGACAKCHLLSFLQAMKNGSICWDDTGELMVSTAGNQALLEHLSLGMFFMVVTFDMVKLHENHLRSLIAADNFDAGFALGQTDIALLEAVHASTKILKPVPPATMWDSLLPMMEKIKGAAWGEDDIAAVYNFLMVVGDVHVDFLVLFAPFVDFDEVCLDPRDWDLAANCAPLRWDG